MIKKNIALISPSENAYSETFIQQHRNNLEGTIIFYFNGSLPKENDIEGELLNRVQSLFYKVLRKFKLTKFNANELALLKSFKKQKIHVVVAEYGTTAVAINNVCKYLKLPLIPIFHGYDASIKSVLENFKTRYQTLFEYASTVIAVSNKIAETLVNLGCDEQKIVVTPCAPDERFFEIIPNFKNPLFVGVGRFVDKKAPYYTILAFYKVLKQFPGAKLIIAGNGPLYNTCKNLINHLKVLDNVKLLGVITPKELTQYFKEALAFVQHSIIADNGDSEGTPVAVLEASAAGLPVISTFHAGIPDVIIDGKTGYLVNEHDVDEMASKMLLLLNDYDKAKRMGNYGKLNIKNHFSKKQHIDILNNIILETLENKSC
tara:strand:- start:52323 stop:53444 length:1122 start_codon:yes stop_codon:yes gene_type:complete